MDLKIDHEKLKKALGESAKSSPSVWDEMLTRTPAGPPKGYTIPNNPEDVYLSSKDHEFITQAMMDEKLDIVKNIDINDLKGYSGATGPSATIKTGGFRGSGLTLADVKRLKEEKVKDGYFRLVELEFGTRVKRFEVHFDGVGITNPDFIVASIPEWFKEVDAKLLAEGIYNSVVEIQKAKDKLL